MNEKSEKNESRIKIRGYAKINLHLDITGRMDGGYHRVETVMQTVSLFDDVTLILTDGDRFTAECNIAGVPDDDRNIAVRAAKLFREKMGISVGGKIVIDKHIPMAAGMAGGSADGAAVLRGFNQLYGDPLSVEELCELGGELGADVPFCIVGGTAYADGRGDILHPFPKMPDCHIVCACEGEGVSTPWAYGLLDRLYDNFDAGSLYIPKNTENLREALLSEDIHNIANAMYNIFEAPVLAHRPVAEEIRRILRSNRASGAMMSGSGPSVFGIFEDGKDAQAAALALEEKGYRPYICHPVSIK